MNKNVIPPTHPTRKRVAWQAGAASTAECPAAGPRDSAVAGDDYLGLADVAVGVAAAAWGWRVVGT